MPLYGGIDLHANNRVVVLLNAQDQGISQRRFSNPLPTILEPLAPSHSDITGVVVESTSNWYWLVDGLREAADRVPLANPAALQQDSGLKYTDDHAAARWWAQVVRLGVLPEGDLSPQAARAVREVWRKGAPLVRQPTANGLSGQNLLARHPGVRCSVQQRDACTKHDLERLLPEAHQGLAVTSSLALLECLSQQSKTLEKAVPQSLQPTPVYEQRLPVDGSGTILAQTIGRETGASGRVPTVGNEASDCRGVTSTKISTGKRQGQGNTKNGTPSREGADMEAAPFALRCNPPVQRFDQRQPATSPLRVARQAVAHTLSRACYSLMRDLVPLDVHQAFGGGRAGGWVGGGDGEEEWFITRRVMRPDLNP